MDSPKHLNPLPVVRFAATMIDRLAASGITVDTSDNFADFKTACASFGKGDPTEEFSVDFMDVMPADGLWISTMDEAGELIGVQAMRRDTIIGITLADYWNQHLARIHGGKLGSRHCPASAELAGTLVYHGDMWIDPKYRKNRIANNSSHLAMGLALLKWNPDFVYCFIPDKLYRGGLGTAYGYNRGQPRAVDWIEPPPNVAADDWFVWSSNSDLNWLVRTEGPVDW